MFRHSMAMIADHCVQQNVHVRLLSAVEKLHHCEYRAHIRTTSVKDIITVFTMTI